MLDKNPLFETIINTKESKKISALIEKALHDQWHDLVLSGIVNTVYAKYQQFFTRRRGAKAKLKKSVTKAEEDIVESPEDLVAQAKENLQQDKISIAEKFLLMAPLMLFLRGNVDSKMKSVGSYYNFRSSMADYLKFSANKAGQSIIDKIPTPKAVKFRLSNTQYKAKIKERVDRLVKGMDNTTKERLVNSLVRGIKAGETKTEMVKRLQIEGDGLSKTRAKTIVYTETEAIAEYMRLETAKMNGIAYKVWVTVADSKVCPICEGVDGQRVRTNQNFKTEIGPMQCPPLHTMCRCMVDYDVDGSLCSDYIKSANKTLEGRIDTLFQKAANKDDQLYEATSGGMDKCVNTENVWAGGESNVGKDKDIAAWADELEKYKGSELMYDKILAQAESQLTTEGMVQLKLQAGLKGETAGRVLEDRFREGWKSKIAELDGIGDVTGVLSEDEFNALRLYTDVSGRNYQLVNSALRHGEMLNESMAEQKVLSDMLDQAIAKLPGERTTVFRGLALRQKDIDKILKDSVFTDMGYMSTTKVDTVAKVFARKAVGEQTVIMEIKSKTGVRIKDFSAIESEEEILFPRGTKFKVLGINFQRDPFLGREVYKIDLEEVVSKSKSTDKLWAEILTTADKQKAKYYKEQNERI